MADTNNIYQRAIDIFNKHVEPDISQGGGGSGGPQYIHTIQIAAIDSSIATIKFGKESSDSKECKLMAMVTLNAIMPFEDAINNFATLIDMVSEGKISNVTYGEISVCDKDNLSTIYTKFGVDGIYYEDNDGDLRLNFYYSFFDWNKGQTNHSFIQLLNTDQMQIMDVVEEIVY